MTTCNNTRNHFDTFVEKFFTNRSEDGIKTTTSRMGMKNVSFSMDEVSRLAQTDDIIAKRGTTAIWMEFTYFGAYGFHDDEIFIGERPPAVLAITYYDRVFFFHVASSQQPESARIVYKMRSNLDESAEFTFTQNEAHFDILLADMLEQSLRRVYSIPKEDSTITACEAAGQPVTDQVALLAALPAHHNNWIPAEHLGALATSIQNRVKADPLLWLHQGRDLGISTKYLGLRIDQRDGGFIVTGEVTPHLLIQERYPDHFYPQGWDSSCNLHAGLLKMVLDLNKAIGHRVTREQVRMQVAYAGEALQELVSTRNLEIQTRKVITPEQLMKFYGKK